MYKFVLMDEMCVYFLVSQYNNGDIFQCVSDCSSMFNLPQTFFFFIVPYKSKSDKMKDTVQ